MFSPLRNGALPRLAVLAACVLALCVSHAHAQTESRHLGVQLRLQGGPMYLHATQGRGHGQSDNISGAAGAVDLMLGSMVSERWSLGLELLMAHTGDASHGVLPSTNFSTLCVGPAATYWLMPANVYFAGLLGLMRSSVSAAPIHIGASFDIPAEEVSDMGMGLQLSAGKVFWLDPRWTLGASAAFLFGAANNPIAGQNGIRYLVGFGGLLTLGFH